ncbi:iron-sulfur cluster assembly scaffold protein [Mesorhizobium sp. IMUNJ 23033]|uniref:iron-sulfur cluster assembly scaffold protein n=1 Tax=Mesorhizobium sp. IMUNJ 23033 TaxID=3378039 RepID=UPI003850DC4B
MDYSDKVKEYSFTPKNAGVLETANAVCAVGAIACGNALKMISTDPVTETFKVEFQTFSRGDAAANLTDRRRWRVHCECRRRPGLRETVGVWQGACVTSNGMRRRLNATGLALRIVRPTEDSHA